ncbi:hypothetical protein KM1_011430 [Entamoeba histolytica HM-3:IMSS]|uniref:Mediator complex subunit 14 n=1 Tax=Entamoeba histolytica HM-3:IMSS TaxID=885315 RepID=M7WJU5_ENTHI|nr:hypothetical protein KM1_011430 [Entamoeba histolytica HM-3:IMSS]
MEVTTQTGSLITIIKNTIASLTHNISKGINSGERDEIIQALECGIHTLGKLLVLTRWLGRNPVLHDIDNFNWTCQQSIIQLHTTVKKMVCNAKQDVLMRKRIPEISIALQVLLEATYPLPSIPVCLPNFNKINTLIERRIWKYYYTNYNTIDCNSINVIGGMLYLYVRNSFNVWLTIANLDALFNNDSLKWKIVHLNFYTPNETVASDETINLHNRNLRTQPEYSLNPIQTLIDQLIIISKNKYFDSLFRESQSPSLRLLYPHITSKIVIINNDRVLQIFYWNNNYCLEYRLNNLTTSIEISHSPNLPSTLFNLNYSLEEQLSLVSKESAIIYEKKMNEQLSKNGQTKEPVLNTISVSPFTGKINLISPYISQKLLNYYSDLFSTTNIDKSNYLFEDLYIHAHYLQTFIVAKTFFKKMHLEILNEDTLKLIAGHTNKFEQIKGEILKPKCIDIQDQNYKECSGLPFKIQVSENRYLCFIISKTPEENLICVGFKGESVNYCSCSKEVFNNNISSMKCVEKITVFCQESYTKYSTKIYLECFKDIFNGISTTGSTLVTSLKNKTGFILLNRNLPFVVIVEQPPEERNFAMIVELNNCSINILNKFKGGEGFQLIDKKMKLSVPKSDVEQDVKRNVKRLIKFIHLISFVNKVIDKVEYFNENTISFNGFYICFESETFDSVQFTVSLDKKYQHLNELIKFDFIDSPDNEISNRKTVLLKDCGCIQNSLSSFVLYFDGLIKLFSSINTSCVSISITEFTSVTIFVNTENEKVTQQNFVMIFSFNTKLEEKTMSFFSRWLDTIGKKKFPMEVFRDTLKQIPIQFKISEAEKYMKILLSLIHLLLMIEFVFINPTKTQEGRCYKIIIRPDLFLKIPSVINNDVPFLTTLTQSQHNDCLTRYFNIRFSNPFKSGNFIDAKNVMALMCKKPTPFTIKIINDFEPLITFCTSSLCRDKFKHLYDFNLIEAVDNRYYITLIMYNTESDLETRSKSFELRLNYHKSILQLASDRRNDQPLISQFIQSYSINKINSFKDLVALLQQTFEK